MRRLLITIFVIIILYSPFSIPNCLAEITWQPIGPFGGSVGAIAIDPTNSQTVYAGTGGGVFKSTNGGASWTMVNSGLTSTSIFSLVIDPINSQTVYAGTGGGVFKSTNGGASWTMVNSGLTSTSISSLVIDQTNSQTVYAGTWGGGVFKSTNGGSSWTAASNGLTGTYVHFFAIDPTNSQTIYAGTIGGVSKSTNGGASWNAANNGINTFVDFIIIDPTNSQTIYIGTDGGAFKSTNGGASWTASNNGLTNSYLYSLVIDPTNSKTVYAGTYGGGIFKSTNGGTFWTAVNSGLTETYIRSLAIDPTNSQTIYAGTTTGIFKSTNGGVSWTAVKSGVTATSISSLAIDPTNSQTVYLTILSKGIVKSTNGGASWIEVNNGLTSRAVSFLVIDQTNSQTLYAGTWGGVFKSTNGGSSWNATSNGLTDTIVYSLAIDPTNGQTLYAGTYEGGIYISTDGGTSWNAANNGLSDIGEVYSLAVDPTDSQTVYAGTRWGGEVFKSTNGGTSWTAVNSGMTNRTVSFLVIDQTNSRTVYAGTWGSGVFKSTNGGASWNTVNSGLTNSEVYSVAIDPTNNQTIYVGTGGGGVFKSTNGGASWTATNSGLTNSMVQSLAIDPTNSQTIYAGTSGGGVLKTVYSFTPIVVAPTSVTFNIGKPGSFKITASGWPQPTLSVADTLPNGLSFDPATGIVSGTPLLGSAGTYTLMFTAGNGLPPDASKAVTVTILASSALNVAITTPTNNATVTALTGITGTAGGNGLSVVDVQVTDGIYYLQSNGGFAAAPAWLTAGGKTTWTLNTSTVTWVEGITYTISARANSSKTTTASFRIQPAAAKQAAILSAAFTPDGIKAGDGAAISGSLVKGDTTALAGKTVKIIITPPSTATVPNPSPLISTRLTDAGGNFNSGTLSSFATPGIYTVQVRFEGDATYQATSQSLSLPVVAQSGYAIIVVGKAADNSLLDLHTATATNAYNTLITKRGFLDSNIIPLISSTNGAVTRQQIQDAISRIKAKYAASPAPFYLIMIDHGSQSGFMIDSQTLTPAELGAMMDNFESGISAATLDTHKRFLIVGTCYSGKFQSLSKPGRVIITSSAAGEQSLAGSTAYNGATVALSGGDYFIDSFFSFLGRGDNFRDAYDQAAAAVELRDPRKAPLALHSGVVDTLAQHPLLDDNGDGTASYRPTGDSDGAATAARYLGEGIRVPAGGNPTDITGVTPMTTLSPTTTTTTLWVSVNDNSRISRAAWVEVRTPDTTVSGSGTGQVIPGNLDSMELFYDGNKWSGDYSKFSTAGRYDIYYYTRDSQTDDISPMAHSVVYKKKDSNTVPSAFNLISPDNGATPGPLFPLTWQESSDTDGLTYTLLVAKDQNFINIVYREEDIPQASAYTYIPKDALKDTASATGGYYCQNGVSSCYWKVQAIDGYGAMTESNTRSFTIVATNAWPGIIKGYVFDATTGAPVVGANVTAGGSQFTTVGNGGFAILLLSGVYNVTATANGYQTKTLANIALSSGSVYDAGMSLEGDTATSVKGDLNGDGKVDLADAILALQVMSNITPVRQYYNVGDVNGDGMIGLPEAVYILQKAAGIR